MEESVYFWATGLSRFVISYLFVCLFVVVVVVVVGSFRMGFLNGESTKNGMRKDESKNKKRHAK